MVAVTIRAGLTVDDVLVAGRRETKRSDLLSAIDAQRGDPIIVFDPTAARQRVMNLGWVADAKVERRLPNTIYVRLSERSPVAVWQRNGEFSLVDAEGVVIGESSAGQRRDLTLIVGAEAPRHASTLLVMLDTQPQLMERVVAAVRVADRRWNLRLNNGIDVRLPEINPQAAWDHLAELEAEHKLLERDIILIDLRLPERLVVRMRPLEGRRPRAPGEHT
jgi:cell division protein FtsQ